MMKLIIFVLFWLIPGMTMVYGQEKFVVKGRINGVKEGTVVRLDRSYEGTRVNIGKDTIKNNRFVIRGESVEIPGVVELMLDGDSCFYGFRNLWINTKKVRVKGNSPSVSVWKISNKTPEQREENRLINKVRNEMEVYEAFLYQNMDEYFAEVADRFIQSKPERADYPLSRKLDSLLEQSNLGLLDVIGENENISTVGLYKLYEIVAGLRFVEVSDYQRRKIEELYLRLDTIQKNSVQGNLIHAFLFTPRIAEVGDEMVDGVLFDLEGKEHRLSDYKGKYILLDFWGAYCGACVRAQPELEQVARKYPDSLHVLCISLEISREIWQKSASHLPGIQLSDLKGKGGLVAQYGFISMPQFVLIGPDGKIRVKWVGYGPGLIELQLKRCWGE